MLRGLVCVFGQHSVFHHQHYKGVRIQFPDSRILKLTKLLSTLASLQHPSWLSPSSEVQRPCCGKSGAWLLTFGQLLWNKIDQAIPNGWAMPLSVIIITVRNLGWGIAVVCRCFREKHFPTFCSPLFKNVCTRQHPQLDTPVLQPRFPIFSGPLSDFGHSCKHPFVILLSTCTPADAITVSKTRWWC
jgi:hypothetical protein